MLIVGERINTSRKQIAEATEARNRDFILREAKLQEEAGAHFIDVNAGTFAEKVKEHLLWLVDILHKEISIPLCIDSSDPDVVSEALSICSGENMVNCRLLHFYSAVWTCWLIQLMMANGDYCQLLCQLR